MTDAKKVPQLPADPMGLFSELQNHALEPNDAAKSRASLAQEAALQRQTDVLEDNNVENVFCQEFTNLEHWLVFSEAIPICLGIHPRDTGDINISNIQSFNDTKAAVKSEQGKLLNLINPNDQPALWRVIPADFVGWMASQNLNPIQSLVTALLWDKQNEPLIKIKDKIVSAAFSILANVPRQCTDIDGKVSAEAIYEIMNTKAATWFELDELPLNKQAVINQLSKLQSRF